MIKNKIVPRVIDNLKGRLKMYAELMRKTCTKCGLEQSINQFYKNERYVDGYAGWCKTCKRDNARANPKAGKRWVEANRKRSNQHKQNYVDKNPEKVRASKARWSKANSKKVLAKTRKYQAAKLLATPKWLTAAQIKEIEQFYIYCPSGYEVDHILPLQGKDVRGLHVPWNLQYLTISENRKKSKKC